MSRDEMIRWMEARGWNAEWTLVPDDEVRRWFEEVFNAEKEM